MSRNPQYRPHPRPSSGNIPVITSAHATSPYGPKIIGDFQGIMDGEEAESYCILWKAEAAGVVGCAILFSLIVLHLELLHFKFQGLQIFVAVAR